MIPRSIPPFGSKSQSPNALKLSCFFVCLGMLTACGGNTLDLLPSEEVVVEIPEEIVEVPEEIVEVTSPVEIPNNIEAESFRTQEGIQIQEINTGGDQVAFIENGDYTEYQINVPESGSYNIAAIASSGSSGGTINIESNGEALSSVLVRSTGGWGSYSTVTANLELEAGEQTLRLAYTGGDGYLFNLDSFLISAGSVEINDACIEVTSLNELANYQDVSDHCVRMTPGTYHFNPSNVGDGTSFENPKLLLFTGSNNEFIFDNVKFEYDTDIFRSFGSVEVLQFQVVGNNNSFYNLTMEDIGDTVPTRTALAISLDGADNLIEGFHVTTRGSYPYGYGDIFGKGSGSVIGHRKHGGVQFRGDRNHLKDTELYLRSYGHGIFIQGAEDALIEGIYMEGELRTVGEVLAEEGTGTPADEANFMTVWGYDLRDLDEDYQFSLQEDGIRAYSQGVIYGTDSEQRDTQDITVIDSTVKFMRSGVTLGLTRGTSHVENCTALGTESGFWVGGNSKVINSRGDTSVGPLYSEDIARGGSEIELTLVDNIIPKIGNMPSIFIGGDSHNFTLKDETTEFNSEILLQVGGTRFGHRWLAGSDESPPQRDADNITIDNQTAYPVILNDNTDRTNLTTCGEVTDNGSNNSVNEGNDCN